MMSVMPIRTEEEPALIAPHQTQWASQSVVYGKTVEVLCDLLSNASHAVEEKAQGLNITFMALAAGAKNQGEQIQKIMDASREMDIGGERFTIQDFLAVFSGTLSNLMEKIVFIAEMSVRMAYHLDDATAHLGALESFVQKISKINKETNLLALNATIEAARFGAEGKGFGVVAGEVKGVSQSIQTLTLDMNKHIGAVSNSLRSSYEVTQKLATTDMSENILARERLETLLGGLIAQNDRLTEVMRSAVNDSERIANNISQAVIGMQFQDRNSQEIGNVVGVLRRLADHLEATPLTMPRGQEEMQEMAVLISELFTLSEFRKMVIDKMVAEGLMDAVYKIADAPPPKNNDDIELF